MSEQMEFADGKYTVINENGKLSALRYGEPWNRSLTGDNLVYWMLVDAIKLKEERDALAAKLAELEGQEPAAHRPGLRGRGPCRRPPGCDGGVEMSTAKHTPGPWRVAYSKFSIVETPDGAKVAECKNLTGLVNLQANARLIAAAPELLEALRKYELPIDINNIALSCIEFGSEAVEKELQRRAAIAKALGEQQ